VFHTLKEAVAFYAQRDSDPGKWYPKNANGSVAKYNDLPVTYRGNVEMAAPFGRKPGQSPALSDAEIEDIVAFLRTLTDGFHAALRAENRSP
jgi:cytochrome c peroxidase